MNRLWAEVKGVERRSIDLILTEHSDNLYFLFALHGRCSFDELNRKNAFVKLIERSEVAHITPLKSAKVNPLADVLMHLLSLNKLNQLYDSCHHLQGKAFADAILDALKIQLNISEQDLNKIPVKGPFITVSNHPIGGIEGLLLVHILAQKRPDLKILVNQLLQKIEPLNDFFIPVDVFEGADQMQHSVRGIKSAIQHVRSGGALSFFPAGEVSSYRTDVQTVTDREWQPSILRFIQKVDVPVVPIYFSGSNGLLFQMLGLIHPHLRTANLANQLFDKSGKSITVRIGKPVTQKQLGRFENPIELGRYLRAKTYALGAKHKVKPFFKFKTKPRPIRTQKVKPIIEETDPELLIEEIRNNAQHRLLTHQQFEVYLAGAKEVPNVLREIGRLREITFRAAGEGTQREQDLDEYDLYYQHLFLWDTAAQKLVGAYRIGFGASILFSYGMGGFYCASLFDFEYPFRETLSQCIELGRSFVVPEYQRKMQPLFLLWKGLLKVLLKHSDYRYIMGPVSISNDYSRLSKSIMVEFVKKHHFDEELAQYVHPKKAFTFTSKTLRAEDLIPCAGDDFKFIDQLIADIEPQATAMPVLLKKYIRQNARIIGFNVDPHFSSALDGLMVLDVKHIPSETIAELKAKMQG